MKKRLILLLLLIITQYNVNAQEKAYFVNDPITLSQVQQKLERLNYLGRVMYLAAHPDDENQKIISYYNYARHFDVAYLSLTRGDGGQNLIGNEIKSELGLIRSFELLKARHIDGGKQLFTRAIDFGYSKTAEETISLWNKEAILGDVVKSIREFEPDVIILRFPPDKRAGHGHHTASATLALEAFDIVANSGRYVEHFKDSNIKPWQPKRIFTNTGRWWNKSITDESDDVIKLDIGNYNSMLGQSYHQIAIRSRTSHKTQGFGSSIFPQQSFEYLELLKGEKVEKDAFDGIDTSWTRVKGGKKIGEMAKNILDNFDFLNPYDCIASLLELKKNILDLKNKRPVVLSKIKLIDEIIIDILGMFTSANTKEQYYTIDSDITVNLFLNNRSSLPVKVEDITLKNGKNLYSEVTPLSENIAFEKELSIPASSFVDTNSKDKDYTQPFWLKRPFNNYSYNLTTKEIGPAIQPYPFMIYVLLDIKGYKLELPIPVKHFRNDPVDGRVLNPLAIVPAVSIKASQELLIFSDDRPKTVDINLRSFSKVENMSLDLNFKGKKGWKWSVKNGEKNFSFDKNEEKQVKIEISPPSKEAQITFDIVLKGVNKYFDKTVKRLEYSHIPKIVYTLPAKIKAVKFNLKKSHKKIAYIMGSGDSIPTVLKELGFKIDIIEANTSLQKLKNYDVLILGIRALNTIDEINFYMDTYFKFVAQGGNMIVQYNTSRGVKTENIAPYKLTLGRGRVTDEYSELEFLDKSNIVLNKPNKITKKDFKGWVQERGLYFPREWDDAFTPLISWHDKGEKPLKGGLLVAKYQEGTYTYTGISFFREIPAGVSGAIRLFTNLIEQE